MGRVLLALLGTACADVSERADPPSGSAAAVVDAAGRSHRFDVPAGRIVSLVPSATLTLRALGATDRLVGRTDFDSAPWAQGVPSVGGGLEPNVEALVALRPDLVIRFAGAQDPRTPDRLDELGIPHFAIRPDRIADVLEIVQALGRATGRDARADSLVARIEAELEAVRASVRDRPPVRIAYVLGGTPPWVAGPGTYIHEVIELVGGMNVFADLGTLYGAVSPEELAAREIDVVLVAGAAAFDRTLAPGARVEEVGPLLELPGPAVAQSARLVAGLVHPDLTP